jgi:hypothetical protein
LGGLIHGVVQNGIGQARQEGTDGGSRAIKKVDV